MRLAGRPCGVSVAHGAAGEWAERRMELGAGRKKGRRRKNVPTGGPRLSARLGKRATCGAGRTGADRWAMPVSRVVPARDEPFAGARRGERAARGRKTGLKRSARLREKRGERAAEKEVGRTGLSCWVGFGFSTGLGTFLVFFFPFLFLFQTPLKSILNSKEILIQTLSTQPNKTMHKHACTNMLP